MKDPEQRIHEAKRAYVEGDIHVLELEERIERAFTRRYTYEEALEMMETALTRGRHAPGVGSGPREYVLFGETIEPGKDIELPGYADCLRV